MNVLILVIFVGVVDILGEAKRGKAVDEEVVLSVVGGVPFLSLGKLHKLCVCVEEGSSMCCIHNTLLTK